MACPALGKSGSANKNAGDVCAYWGQRGAQLLTRSAVLCLIVLVASPRLAGASPPPAPASPPSHREAQLGVYVRGVHNIDVKASTADIDLFIWMQRHGEGNGLEHVEVVNAQKIERSYEQHIQLPNGDHFYSMRMDIKSFQKFDLLQYPLDSQVLELVFADTQEDNESLRFVADTENTKLRKNATLTGWFLGAPTLSVTEWSHRGGLRVMQAQLQQSPADRVAHGKINEVIYSRATMTLPIKRVGVGYFFKLFGTVFLAGAVSFLCFFIKPTNLDPRFGLGVGGIFAVVASNFVLSSLLPETHLVTMGEAILLLTYVAIFFVLVESVIALQCVESGKEQVAIRLDKVCGILVPSAYVIAVGFLIARYTGYV